MWVHVWSALTGWLLYSSVLGLNKPHDPNSYIPFVCQTPIFLYMRVCMHIWYYSLCMVCFVLVNPSYYVHPVRVPNSRCARVLSIYAWVHTYVSPCMECFDWLTFIFICFRPGSWTNLMIQIRTFLLRAKLTYSYICVYACIRDIIVRIWCALTACLLHSSFFKFGL